MRLSAYLARAGVTSRRKSADLIVGGRITVNGQVGQLNTNVSEGDEVKFDGRVIQAHKLIYILLHKPAGTVTTLNDPQKRKTVIDLIDIPERIVPVGRLDYDTTGALLLTNDGELANQLMHPSFEVDKVYEAEVEGKVTDEILKKLQNGVELEDGLAAPAKVHVLQGRALQRLELVIHEGRKHQVKRMLAAVGLPVKKLHRPKYANLDVNNLKPGEWRELSEAEITALKRR